jgi:hypothetical protein
MLLPEFSQEMVNIRKAPERDSEGKFGWKLNAWAAWPATWWKCPLGAYAINLGGLELTPVRLRTNAPTPDEPLGAFDKERRRCRAAIAGRTTRI